jgi:hypothetical protein
MDDDQLTRFEFFSRSHFPREKIKEIIRCKLGIDELDHRSSSGVEVTEEMAIVVGSLAKAFCGDLVERCKSRYIASI